MTPIELARECAEKIRQIAKKHYSTPGYSSSQTVADECTPIILSAIETAMKDQAAELLEAKQCCVTLLEAMDNTPVSFFDHVPGLISQIDHLYASLRAERNDLLDELAALRKLADAVEAEIGDDYPYFAMQAALTAARQAQGAT